MADSIATPLNSFSNHYDSIPPENIYASLKSPNIIIYRAENPNEGGEHFNFRLFDANGIKDTCFFHDNMVRITEISIDSIRLGDGKFPEIIFKWTAAGSHRYNEHSGRRITEQAVCIWDINKMEEVFFAIPYSTHEEFYYDSANDSLAETACTTKYRLSIHEKKKEVLIDSLVQSQEGDCKLFSELENGTYKYLDGRFVKK